MTTVAMETQKNIMVFSLASWRRSLVSIRLMETINPAAPTEYNCFVDNRKPIEKVNLDDLDLYVVTFAAFATSV